ncbi:hypothetical protein DMENIID0001_160490 [Sergentomyia squamirostris]
MTVLNKCCCFSLKTGGVILGWLGVIMSFVQFVLSIILICNSDRLGQLLTDAKIHYDYDVLSLTVQIILGIYIVFTAVGVVTSSFLIVGTLRNNHNFIYPWLLIEGLSIGLELFSTLYSCYMIFILDSVIVGLIYFSIYAVYISVQCYLWLAIFSLYQNIHSERHVAKARVHAISLDGINTFTDTDLSYRNLSMGIHEI